MQHENIQENIKYMRKIYFPDRTVDSSMLIYWKKLCAKNIPNLIENVMKLLKDATQWALILSCKIQLFKTRRCIHTQTHTHKDSLMVGTGKWEQRREWFWLMPWSQDRRRMSLGQKSKLMHRLQVVWKDKFSCRLSLPMITLEG